MFDLELYIEKWRREYAGAISITETSLAELENHLRDEILILTDTGLTEEEAFIIAQKRLGDTSTIVNEYTKANPALVWSWRFFWMITGLLFFSMIGALRNLTVEFTNFIFSYTGFSPIAVNIVGLLIGVVTLVATVGFIVYFCTASSSGPFQRFITRRWTIWIPAALGVILPLTFFSQRLLFLLMTRVISIERIGRIAYFRSISQFCLSAALWISLAILLFWLAKRRRVTC